MFLDMETFQTKHIALPNGNTLEISIYPGFLEKLKEHFSLGSVSEVNDDYIRMYIWGAFKSALDKAEKDS